MDKRRIKSILMLGITMMSLSGCSTKEIKDFLSDKYKIMQECDDEDNNYYLVKVEKDLIKTKNFKIIGIFETEEEAKDYLDRLTDEGNDTFGVLNGAYVVIIGGIIYYCIRRMVKENQKEKVLKK